MFNILFSLQMDKFFTYAAGYAHDRIMKQEVK